MHAHNAAHRGTFGHGQPHWYDSTHDGYFWRKVAFFATHLGGPRPSS